MNTDHAYAAGLFDGEGTVTLTRNKATETRAPAVSLSSTTYELVKFMQDQFGGQIVKLPNHSDRGWKQAWHWQASRDRALTVVAAIVPYLKEPEKIRRSRLLLDKYKSVTKRNGKYSSEERIAREQFDEEFFSGSAKARL